MPIGPDAAVRDATVVLVHGLWMRAPVMWPLGVLLARLGWHVGRFGYPSLRETLDANADRLASHVAGQSGRAVHLVGHSLGGLVILRMLERHADARIGRVVLLGPPYRDSLAARTLAASPRTARLVGRSLGQWLGEPRRGASVRVPVGVIAGVRPLGLGRLVVALPGANDGAVSVAETEVPGANDRVLVPESHSSMLISPTVARQIDAFLRRGHFDTEAA